MSDTQSGLYSVDTRTGKILTGYKGELSRGSPLNYINLEHFAGISGAVNSIVAIPSNSNGLGAQFASVALDRFFRLHAAYPLPEDPKDRLTIEKRSETEKTPLKIFLKSTPTAVAWDGILDDSRGVSGTNVDATDDDDDDVSGPEDEDWDGMDVVVDDDDESESDTEEPAKIRSKRSK